MLEKHFELNENTIPVVEEIGRHMPGGFLIYKAETPEELIYANHKVFEIFGCVDLDDFKRLTGYTFRGLVHPDDYEATTKNIWEQISRGDMDYLEYRIIRKDGAVRWVDDYGHFADTKAYGGLFFVFISDITDKRERMEEDNAVRSAVIRTLTDVYNTVWLINDVEKENCSLYHGDTGDSSIHAEAIRNALSNARYTDAKTQYVNTMVAPEDRERMQQQISLPYILNQLADKEQFSVTFLHSFRDALRYYRIDFAKVAMPGGKTGVMMGFRDVDDEIRKDQDLKAARLSAQRAEEENRRLTEEVQSAARLADLMASVASLLSNIPAMSFSKDAETGRYLACNQPFAEYANKTSPDEVIGRTDLELFDAETAAHVAESDRRALSMDEPYVFFEDIPDAAGSTIRSLQTTKLIFRETSGRLCTLGMCVDVTEIARMKASEVRQQQMEERLALQERLLQEQRQRERQDRMIVALSSDYRSTYYVNLDEDEAVCYQGDRRFAEAPAAGSHFSFLEKFTEFGMNHVAESYRDGFLRFIQPENIRSELLKHPITTYRYLELRDGQESYAMLRIAGVRHREDFSEHDDYAICAGFTDIDAEMRKSMAQQQTLIEALAAAEEANKAKTAFLSSMSHEIRTPMNAIIGLDSLALRDETISDTTREYLEKINGSAKHLLGLINDILDMSRIESGRMVLRREEFSLSSLLEQVNALVASQCSHKGLSFECHIEGPVGDYFIGDDMKLRQVLLNILSNAVKFTDAPGSITLTIERINVYDGQSTLRFVIADTGIGMDKAFLPKVFDSFTQEDSSRNNKYGSTGLGMAITKNIVELMNGSIGVESEKGVGTVFTVVITMKNSEHPNAEIKAVSADELQLLIVDNDPVACEHTRIVMGEAGIHADIATDGQVALQKIEAAHAKHRPYNLILLERKLPDRDGLALAREIRKRDGHDTTVLILTANNWDEIMDEALCAGVDGFLAKPLFAANVFDEFERIARRNNLRLHQEKRQADLKGRHILMAEDILINAEIMKEILQMREAVIDHAENGRIALDMFKKSVIGYYDAVLMDIRMPEMDGLAAAEAIRALGRADAKNVPIVAMTANAFDEDVQRSLQAGMNAHLSKPVDPELLYRTLEELIWMADQQKQ